jgi:hypothetical protein
MRALALLLVGAAPVGAQVVTDDTLGFRTILALAVTDTIRLHEVALSDALVLRVYREVDARGTPMGWNVAVYQRPASDTSRNLLYHSLAWHGPYPNDFLAWIHDEQYYPDDRVLPVWGYPFELRLVCRACVTAGDSAHRHFTAGTFEAGVRRLPGPVPRPPPDDREPGDVRLGGLALNRGSCPRVHRSPDPSQVGAAVASHARQAVPLPISHRGTRIW